MLLYFFASCIAFIVIAARELGYMYWNHPINMPGSIFLFLWEVSAAGTFALAGCATILKKWRTGNKWGIAGSLVSICVPLPALFWGVNMFWRYLLACLWPSLLFGAIGLILFSTGGWAAGGPVISRKEQP